MINGWNHSLSNFPIGYKNPSKSQLIVQFYQMAALSLLGVMCRTFFLNLFEDISIIADIMVTEVIIKEAIVVNNFINTCLSINYDKYYKVLLKYRYTH